MIKSYGIFWKSEDVFWGRQNMSGTLLGSRTRTKRAKVIDFRQQRGIYALYAEYELVYLGQTGAQEDRLFKRLKAHLSDHLSERWDRFSWFGTQWVTQQHRLSTDTAAIHEKISSSLNILEAITIAVSEPRLNLQRGRWGDAKQYYQSKNPEINS